MHTAVIHLLALAQAAAPDAPPAAPVADSAALSPSGAILQLACVLLLAALVLPELAAYVTVTLSDVRRDDTHDDRHAGRPKD